MRAALSAFTTIFAVTLTGMAFAAGSDTPVTPTDTTKACSDGMVLDPKTKTCVAPKESRLDDDTLYRAAQEFAYAGAYEDAQAALAAMSDQDADRVLTYWGFTHRQLGDWDLGMAYYDRALAQNPDNILARSYLGQALVQLGDLAGALDQLRQIESRGGAGTWPQTSLRAAILSGAGYENG